MIGLNGFGALMGERRSEVLAIAGAVDVEADRGHGEAIEDGALVADIDQVKEHVGPLVSRLARLFGQEALQDCDLRFHLQLLV